MKLLEPVSSSTLTSLNTTAEQKTNHDEIEQTSVEKTRQAVAITRTKMNTLHQQEKSYHKQLLLAQDQYQIWTERAIQLADRDQEKALQCISKRNRCESEVHRLSHSLDQQQTLIREANNRLQRLRYELDEMTQRHNLMRTKQLSADDGCPAAFANLDESLNDTFKRWEASVLEHGYAGDESDSRYLLNRQDKHQMSDGDLLAQLIELTNTVELNGA